MSTEKPILTVYGRDSQQQRSYWINSLSRDIGVCNLVLDYDRPGPGPVERDHIEIELPDEVNQKLVELTKGSPFLIYAALLCVLNVVFHKYTGNRLIVIGSPPRKKNDAA